MKKIGLLLMAMLVFVFSSTALTAKKQGWELINWNSPRGIVNRLTGDEYILPEGWEKATQGVKKISYYNSGGLAGDIATAINIEKFAEKTGIRLEAIGVSADAFDKVMAALISRDGSVPLLLANNPWIEMTALSAGNNLVPLDFLYPPEVQKMYNPNLKHLLYRNGHWMGSLEVSYFYGAIYYRPSWLEKAGVKVPTTYQELYAAAKKVREWAKSNVAQDAYGLCFGASAIEIPPLLQQLTYAQGGRLYENGKYNLSSKEVKNTINYLVDAVTEDIASKEIMNYEQTEVAMVFGAGKAGFALSLMTSYSPKFDTDYPAVKGDWAVLPPLKWDSSTPDEYRGAVICGNAGIINKHSKPNEIAAAMLFLDYLRSREAVAYELIVEDNGTFVPDFYDDSLAKLVDWKLVEKVAKQLGIGTPAKVDSISYKDIRTDIVTYGTNEAFTAQYPIIIREATNQINQAMMGRVNTDRAIKNIMDFVDQY